jgi:hypothetical protein
MRPLLDMYGAEPSGWSRSAAIQKKQDCFDREITRKRHPPRVQLVRNRNDDFSVNGKTAQLLRIQRFSNGRHET